MDYGINNYSLKYGICPKEVCRVISKNRNFYGVVNNEGTMCTAISSNTVEFYVGDFVHVTLLGDQTYITHAYARDHIISKAKNRTSKDFSALVDEQILACHVDHLVVMIAADQRFTLGKLERYLLVFSGMTETMDILISKSDYQEKAENMIQQIQEVYPHLNIYKYSMYDEHSLSELEQLMRRGHTTMLIGASGVGKSTVTNYLLGNPQVETQSVRSDGKGKHTTTTIRLHYLSKSDSYLIDSPGFKGIETSRDINPMMIFEAIYSLEQSCKFSDCQHENEPGCAIKEAIAQGRIDQELFNRYSYQKKKRLGYEKFIEKKKKSKKR